MNFGGLKWGCASQFLEVSKIFKKERRKKKERNYFNVQEAKDSLWDRLLLHLVDVFGFFL